MAYYGNSINVPVVVKNIIIINVIMVVLQFVLAGIGIDLGNYLALHHWLSPQFKWWQCFTYMFMHGSAFDLGATISHIFFNMYGLFMFGSMLERMWGPKRFLTFYIICGLGAGLCHVGVMQLEYSMMREPYEYLMYSSVVGASGAIFGILFAFAYLFPNTEMLILFIPAPIKAKWVVAGYAAIELFSGIGRFQGDNVAHFAHLGGMLFAFIVLKVWEKKRNNFY